MSKQTRKYFEVIIAFGHSTFTTLQLLFPPTNMVLWRYLACWTFSKCQPYSSESCLSICTCTYKTTADNHLHNCICGVLFIKMTVLWIYL